MRPLCALLALLAFGVPATADLDLVALKSSVVQVEVTLQEEDYHSPWKKPVPVETGGTGFYIGHGRLMTNAHVVSNARMLRVKRPDRPDRVEARVLFIGHDCDLALLTVDDRTFFDGMVPMQFGSLPALRSQVAAVGYPIGGRKLSVTEGVVSRIELVNYVHTGVDRHLAIQVDAAINPGNSGGPVVQGGEVVGVAFQTRFYTQSIGYMIPVPVIHHFLKDVEDGKYDGYPSLGILVGSLENATLRECLKVPGGETGIVVLKALSRSSAQGILRRNDVLHAIDEFRVENDATVKVGGEYLELEYVVQEKYVGDTVRLEIRRDGRVIHVPVTLTRWDVVMAQGIEYGKGPEYLVLGGYVFVPATTNYVGSRRFRTELDYWFDEFYTSIADRRPGQEQLVVLSRVLPHDSTRYRDYTDAVVRTVNGKAPRDFRSFVQTLETGERAVIEFEGLNVEPLVLDREKVSRVHEAILKAYGIDEDRFLRGVK